jgi:uncharacterized protein with HEPN domain
MNKPPRNPRVYLEDILHAVAQIEQYTAKGKDAFFAQTLIQDGVIRQLSIIGEAAGKLPIGMKAKHPAVPWKKIVGMRNVIIHDYAETDISTVWIVVERDLTVLRRTAEAMLRETPDRSKRG